MYRLPLLLALASFGAIVALALAGTAHAALPDDVCASLQARAAELEPRIGFVVVDLDSGEACGALEAESFRTASLYKLLVLAEAHEQELLGRFSFDDDMITLQLAQPAPVPTPEAPAEPTQGVPPDGATATPTATATAEPAPRQFTISAREAARRMIVFSDNLSAEALRVHLGKAAVAEAPRRLALDGTSLGQEFITTPEDIARFFTLLYAGELVSARASFEMLQLLHAQEVRDRIPAVLPDDTPIAHKTGLIARYVHDAGIVYAPGGDYVLVLLTEWPEGGSIGQSYDAIHQLSAMVYDAYAVAPPPRPVIRPAAPVSVEATAAAEAADAGVAADRRAEPPTAEVLATPTSAPEAAEATQPAAWWREAPPVVRAVAPLGAAFLAGVLATSLVVVRSRRKQRAAARAAAEADAVARRRPTGDPEEETEAAAAERRRSA